MSADLELRPVMHTGSLLVRRNPGRRDNGTREAFSVVVEPEHGGGWVALLETVDGDTYRGEGSAVGTAVNAAYEAWQEARGLTRTRAGRGSRGGKV